MRDYRDYVIAKKRTLIEAGLGLFLLGIGSGQLIPYLMRQWSHDRAYGVLHIGMGIVLCAVGVFLLLRLIRNKWSKKTKGWKKQVGLLILWYLAAQLILGILQGGAGLLLYRMELLSYEQIKSILYITAAVVQNLVRVFFLFILLEMYFEANWREDMRRLRNAELASMVLSVFTMGITWLPAGVMQMTVNAVWGTVYLLGFTAYFGYRREAF